MTQLLPPKKEVALALLERSNVDVYLDPRAKGVLVPPQFRKEPRLILKIGLNMPVPIPDLRLDEESMSCTLSFNRAKFFCVVPWLSVFAMVGDDGRGMVWPDDVPQELAVRVVDDKGAGVEKGPGEPVAPPSSRGTGKGKSRIQPDAAREERADGAPNDRARRPRKKKKEDTRPVLVAVPSPEAASRREKAPARVEKLDERRESPPPPTPRVAADAPRPPPSTRPKRELPPY